jgi:hypothetical protein
LRIFPPAATPGNEKCANLGNRISLFRDPIRFHTPKVGGTLRAPLFRELRQYSGTAHAEIPHPSVWKLYFPESEFGITAARVEIEFLIFWN